VRKKSRRTRISVDETLKIGEADREALILESSGSENNRKSCVLSDLLVGERDECYLLFSCK